MTPLQDYQKLIASGELQKDAEQAQVMNELEHIYHELILRQRQRDSYVGKLRRKIKPRAPIHGLYLWGRVGTGKTHLIDLFYHRLPTKKIRQHFHAFMQSIHNQLRKHQGEVNPLEHIAKEIADSTVVICFDEMMVTNIADAMVLSELFKHLFEGGVCLITTSNTPPDELYKNGLQRQRFVPVIELIKIHTRVLQLRTIQDYRLKHVDRAGVYYTPLNDESWGKMRNCFDLLTKDEPRSQQPITLFERKIDIVQRTETMIWFEFDKICERPRSQKDYLALSKEYEIFFISNIPVITPAQRDLIISFINLIDVLYDAHRRVVITAAAEPEDLYPDGPLSFDYRRTSSRLIEMRSVEYFRG